MAADGMSMKLFWAALSHDPYRLQNMSVLEEPSRKLRIRLAFPCHPESAFAAGARTKAAPGAAAKAAPVQPFFTPLSVKTRRLPAKLVVRSGLLALEKSEGAM